MTPPTAAGRVLVVDDDALLRDGIRERFAAARADAHAAPSLATGRRLLAEQPFDLVLFDPRLSDGDGVALLDDARRSAAPPAFVAMAAAPSPADAVRVMKAGAADCLLKPVDVDQVVRIGQRLLERVAQRRAEQRRREAARDAAGTGAIVGRSGAVDELRRLVRRVATSGAGTILVTGPSGSGKEVVARAIHAASPQADRPFVAISCTALPAPLLESDLFGHEKGSFTDATASKRGLCEAADGGTLFLDEIGDMPTALQARLLRFLDAKTFRRVGGLREIEVDVRVVAATHRRLPELVASGQFRGDLYYRLNVVAIETPALARHPDDVVPLVDHFKRHFARELGRPVPAFDGAALAALARHAWPGNVRELRNCIERALLLNPSPLLGLADLSPEVRHADATNGGAKGSVNFSLPEGGLVVADMLKSFFEQALERCNGNKTHAARLLGVHRDQVRYWSKRYGLARWVRGSTRRTARAQADAAR